MLGKLTWAAIPFDQPIPLVAGAVVLVAILAVISTWLIPDLKHDSDVTAEEIAEAVVE